MGHVVPELSRGFGQRLHNVYLGAGPEATGEHPDHRLVFCFIFRERTFNLVEAWEGGF